MGKDGITLRNRFYKGDASHTFYDNILIYIFSFFVVTSPILSAYSFPLFKSLSIDEVFLIILTIFGFAYLMLKSKKIIINNLVLFVTYSCLITIFITLTRFKDNFSVSIARVFRDCVYFSFYGILAPSILEKDKIMKCFKISFTIVAVGLAIQFFGHYILKKDIFLWLDFLPLNYSDTSTTLLKARYTNYYLNGRFRCSSFFLEPSYFAYYCMLFLALVLGTDTKYKYEWAIAATIISIASLSFTAMVASAICWFVYFAFNRKISLKTKIFIISVLVVAGSLFLFIISKANETLWKRFLEIVNPSLATSGGHRIYRGFFIFGEYNFLDKIFGTGLGNTVPYLAENNLTAKYFASAGNDYSSAFSYILLSSGIIGFLMYWIPFAFYLAKNRNRNSVMIPFIAFLLIILEENLSLSIFYVFYLSVIFCKDDVDKTSGTFKKIFI